MTQVTLLLPNIPQRLHRDDPLPTVTPTPPHPVDAGGGGRVVGLWCLRLGNFRTYYSGPCQDFQGGGFLFGGKVDLKPKGGLIWGKSGPLYYTLWSLWPKGGGVFGPPPIPPPGYGPAIIHTIIYILSCWVVLTCM